MNHKKLIRYFGLLWMTVGIGVSIWMWDSYRAKGLESALFSNNSSLKVNETGYFISFTPTAKFDKTMIFYPGALVEPSAYAPICRNIAENGYQVLIIKMPWRLASKGYNIPKTIHIFGDTAKQYILAGHSLGAKMAAQFVYENPTLVDKLILMGTTHPRDINLSNIKIPILKIYGSKDGIAQIKEMNKNTSNLPLTTRYIRIKGGNHSQFGYYGFQFGDNKATITREEQQNLILESILSFLNN